MENHDHNIFLLILLCLPLQILACMPTPVISEEPDIPITSAPSVSTPSSVCTPSVCGTIDIVDGNDATIRPVFHQVPEDCDVLYATCTLPTPGQSVKIGYVTMPGDPPTYFVGKQTSGLLFECNSMTKQWVFPGFEDSIIAVNCQVDPTAPIPTECVGPPPSSGSPLPILTPMPDPVLPWNYVVTCVVPNGATAAIDLYDVNGDVYQTLSNPSDNAFSTQVSCYDDPFYERSGHITDIKCRAL